MSLYCSWLPSISSRRRRRQSCLNRRNNVPLTVLCAPRKSVTSRSVHLDVHRGLWLRLFTFKISKNTHISHLLHNTTNTPAVVMDDHDTGQPPPAPPPITNIPPLTTDYTEVNLSVSDLLQIIQNFQQTNASLTNEIHELRTQLLNKDNNSHKNKNKKRKTEPTANNNINTTNMYTPLATLDSSDEDTEFPPLATPRHITQRNNDNEPTPSTSAMDTQQTVTNNIPISTITTHKNTTINVQTTNTTTPNAAPYTTSNDTVPPIVIHNKSLWIQISSYLLQHKISYTRATSTREGIRVLPSTVEDFSALNSFLKKQEISSHTFPLPSAKTIKVVLRGVPQSFTDEQITSDLILQSYVPLGVTRLLGRNNLPAPLVLVHLERKYASIHNLQTVCGLNITVEAKRIPNGPLQCHKCQRFGHSQPNCNAPFRCMKCAGEHPTYQCTKPLTTPALCANCNAPHISTHHSCPQNPLNLKKTYANALQPTSTPPKPQPLHPQTTTKTQALASPQPVQVPQPSRSPLLPTPTPHQSTDPFASALFPLFQQLLKSNPTQEKINQFSQKVTELQKILA